MFSNVLNRVQYHMIRANLRSWVLAVIVIAFSAGLGSGIANLAFLANNTSYSDSNIFKQYHIMLQNSSISELSIMVCTFSLSITIFLTVIVVRSVLGSESDEHKRLVLVGLDLYSLYLTVCFQLFFVLFFSFILSAIIYFPISFLWYSSMSPLGMDMSHINLTFGFLPFAIIFLLHVVLILFLGCLHALSIFNADNRRSLSKKKKSRVFSFLVRMSLFSLFLVLVIFFLFVPEDTVPTDEAIYFLVFSMGCLVAVSFRLCSRIFIKILHFFLPLRSSYFVIALNNTKQGLNSAINVAAPLAIAFSFLLPFNIALYSAKEYVLAKQLESVNADYRISIQPESTVEISDFYSIFKEDGIRSTEYSNVTFLPIDGQINENSLQYVSIVQFDSIASIFSIEVIDGLEEVNWDANTIVSSSSRFPVGSHVSFRSANGSLIEGEVSSLVTGGDFLGADLLVDSRNSGLSDSDFRSGYALFNSDASYLDTLQPYIHGGVSLQSLVEFESWYRSKLTYNHRAFMIGMFGFPLLLSFVAVAISMISLRNSKFRDLLTLCRVGYLFSDILFTRVYEFLLYLLTILSALAISVLVVSIRILRQLNELHLSLGFDVPVVLTASIVSIIFLIYIVFLSSRKMDNATF